VKQSAVLRGHHLVSTFEGARVVWQCTTTISSAEIAAALDDLFPARNQRFAPVEAQRLAG